MRFSFLANDHARAMTLMVIAMLMLPGIDAIAKWLSGTVSAGQVTWGRFFFQVILVLPFLYWTGGEWFNRNLWLHAARGIFIAGATVLFFSGLAYLPIADAISIFFIEPLLVTVLSVFLLGETVGWRRIVAIAVGFAGALIIIRPTFSEIGWPALYPVGAACSFSLYIILTRKLVSRDHPIRLMFFAGLFGLIVMSMALYIGTVSGLSIVTAIWPTAQQWFLLGMVGLIATVAHFMVVLAYHRAPVSILAPFQYVEIIGATILGLVIFNDFPDGVTWLGILIIVGSGIYVFHRESRAEDADMALNATEAAVSGGGKPLSRAAESLVGKLTEADRIWILTGAGISVAAGIPSYRDHDGAWQHSQPMQHSDFIKSATARQRYWMRSAVGWARMRQAVPTATHHALVHLEQAGRITRLVTQNVDGLHSVAGSRNVVDLHGRLDRVRCVECGSDVSREDYQSRLVALNANILPEVTKTLPDGDVEVSSPDVSRMRVPPCESCGGIMKPDVVFYGGQVPKTRVTDALNTLGQSDCLLVLGSSLSVYSGFRFLKFALANDIPAYAINIGVMRGQGLFEDVVAENCDDVVPGLVAKLS